LGQLANFSLVSPDDNDVIARSNDTATELADSDRLLHELFRRAALRHSGAAAVVHPGGELTYRQLDDRVNALAARLLGTGLRPGDAVAIVMDKGWEQVVAALAVPAAGGFFVPVDPQVPRDRLHHLLGHACAAVVVTQPGLVDGVDWPDGVVVLDVPDTDPGAPEPVSTPDRGPDDLAYVIYTSGSTGAPKGVMISHRGAVNTCLDINQRFGVTGGDRVLALSALTFDLAVYDVFGVLAAGATIVVPAPSPAPDPDYWADLVHRTGVTVWNSVPALMELAVGAARPAALASLRLVMLSGDWIRVGLPADIARACPDARVISLGGATEGSIWSILHEIDDVDPAWSSIPYGRPMANQTFHILDKAMSPCPLGVPGDLHIGGTGVAMGYWKAPDLTAASFVDHPETGARIYRTGDLGRYLPDGTIEFLGRDDFQVKIQGFRIELGEVEAALRQCAGVVDAVAAADTDTSADAAGARLVAFVRGDDGLDPEELRAAVGRKLPAYMVPSSIAVVGTWPLTGNGKVDRAALVRGHLPAAEAGGEPQDALEELLAELWADVLDRDAVGTRDGFFALGGQSLLAARLVMAVNAVLDLAVPVRALFEASTVVAFRAWLEVQPEVDTDALLRTAEAVLAEGYDAEDEAQDDPQDDSEVDESTAR
jgi:amino acid adenylation domain-containing protein